MNPYIRVALRGLAVGVGGFLGAIAIAAKTPGISQSELFDSINVGYTALMTMFGLAIFTNLEPTVGITPTVARPSTRKKRGRR